MSIHWLIEPEVFQNDINPLIESLDKAQIPYTAIKFGKKYDYFLKLAMKSPKVIFYGSFSCAEFIQKLSYKDIFVFNSNKYECTKYYPHFGDFLLNSQYLMLPYGDLTRRFNDPLFKSLIKYNELFIRPNKVNKSFTGTVLNVHKYKQLNHLDSDSLVIVSTPQIIRKEWRLVIVDNKVITGGQYKEDGLVVRKNDLPNYVYDFGCYVLSRTKFTPDLAWTLDICQAESGNLFVLEIGPFSCSGLYACDTDKVIAAIHHKIESNC